MHLGSFKFEGQLVSAAIFLAGAKFAGKRDICDYRFTPPPSSDMRGVKGDLADAFIGLWYRISSTWTSRQGIIR